MFRDMIIAQEKKKNNIAEYILYMFQIEDIIRAHNFDIAKLEKGIISRFDQPQDIIEEMKIWYKDLIEKMKREKIKENGHLSFLMDIINQLETIHQSLLKDPDELKYIEIYNWARPNINALRNKSDNKNAGDIEISLNGLYGFLMLKLRKAEISRETAEAISTISNLMAILSSRYKETQ